MVEIGSGMLAWSSKEFGINLESLDVGFGEFQMLVVASLGSLHDCFGCQRWRRWSEMG